MYFTKALSSDRFWYRVALALGAIAVPYFGIMMQKELPNSVEYMSHRYILASVWLALLILSITSHFFKKHLITLVCWMIFALNIWAVWIVYMNNFSLYYCAGQLVVFSALNMSYRRPKLYFAFYGVTISLYLLACICCENPEISTGVCAFVNTILGIVFMLAAKVMINAEKQLQELNQTLEKKVAERTAEAESQAKLLISKNKELEQFAYITSHDLKSPLRNISGFVQLIERKIKRQESGEIEEYIGFVVNSVNKMDAIINDILYFSRLGKECISFKKTNIEGIVKEVCSSMQQDITKHNGTVILQENLSYKICCNERQITQLFQNLIDNGFKYNEQAKPVVEIAMQEREEDYLFSLKDNGIGIQPEFRERIFKIFQRLHTDEAYPGTGIGLAICKRIVENHQGEIWVASTPGMGTTFFFTISKYLSKGDHTPTESAELAM
jgi:signal transduction histidine kinase